MPQPAVHESVDVPRCDRQRPIVVGDRFALTPGPLRAGPQMKARAAFLRGRQTAHVERTRLRELFLSYVQHANELAREPEFYGVLGNSCGVNILHRVADTGHTVLVGRDALLNGFWDRHLYDRGVIDTQLPFEVLRERSLIDERAKAAGDAPDFSQRIRAGLPGPPT